MGTPDESSRIRFGSDGRYELIAPIGTTGRGGVFLARDRLGADEDPVSGRRLPPPGRHAIKLLDTAVVGREAVDRFLAEARVLRTIRHPHVVRAWAHGEDHGFCWYVMDLLPGGNLADHLRKKGGAPAEHALALVFQVLMGLDAIHGAGLVHRDVKLTNVLIDAQGNARVTDFGVAHHPKGTVDFETIPGQALGTPGYGAPEQWAHAGKVGAAADLFATGVLLYRLITRKRPDVLHMAHYRPKLLDEVPEPVRDVMLRSTRPEPEDRYPDAPAMARAVVQARDALLGRSDTTRWMGRFARHDGRWGSDTADVRRWLAR